MALTVISGGGVVKPAQILSAEDKLKHLRAEVNSALEDRIEEMYREASAMKGVMEQVLYRIRAQGFDVQLEDLKTGKWHRIKTEISVLQEVAALLA